MNLLNHCLVNIKMNLMNFCGVVPVNQRHPYYLQKMWVNYQKKASLIHS